MEDEDRFTEADFRLLDETINDPRLSRSERANLKKARRVLKILAIRQQVARVVNRWLKSEKGSRTSSMTGPDN
jgi:hypothetical protein